MRSSPSNKRSGVTSAESTFDHGENISVNAARPVQIHDINQESTGATGYIGGSALHRIASSFPRVKISCLVRDASKGSIVRKAYPNVQVVEGDLDGLELIEREAAAADIVLRTST